MFWRPVSCKQFSLDLCQLAASDSLLFASQIHFLLGVVSALGPSQLGIVCAVCRCAEFYTRVVVRGVWQ